jgi:hypothetical protein
MILIDCGPDPCYGDGISRRSFLRLGAAGLAGLGPPQLLRARGVMYPAKCRVIARLKEHVCRLQHE